ncbi:serine protease 23-like [Bombina bombina]|uniref:serine protease 23-like n=1 Tax=Bombina bombina TaxID=8345 RepID=UPI00235A8F94|nr:serine protease 23-like [Bombina bombina]XP_053555051.1 serine protease 23-like [Bombina bombina]XP_053555052.1 serine protease 23-like [Bombina bombina]
MMVPGISSFITVFSLLLLSISTSDLPTFELIPRRILPLTPSHFTALDAPELSTVCTERCAFQESQTEAQATTHKLDFETAYYNGSRTLTTVALRVRQNDKEHLERRTHSVRTRRQIYGPDMRFSIHNQRYLKDFPFATAVRISTGCTGVLVTERHVLTAAHCIHDGQDYVKGAKMLRVGFLRPVAKSSLRWVRVQSTRVPRGWIGAPIEASMDYDYAVLELRRAQPRPHMRLAVTPPLKDLAGKRMHFSGFDSDRRGELVYRSCLVEQQTEHLLYQHCDAQPGASGSGVYGRLWDKGRWERKVIGVFSGHQWVEISGEPKDYNVAVRLTPLKYAQICYWIRGSSFNCQNE